MPPVEEPMDVSDNPVLNTSDKKIKLLYDKLVRLESELKSDANEEDESVRYEIQTLAVTLHSLCTKNVHMLFKLFEFCLHKGSLFVDMTADIFENSLLKNFDLFNDAHLSALFEKHFDYLLIEIVQNECPRKNFFKYYSKAIESDSDYKNDQQIYYRLYSKMSEETKEKLANRLLDKLSSCLKFLKVESQPLDIQNLYINLAKNKLNIYKLRDFLLIHKKFIPEYGLHLIDSLLNLEKHLYANLIQQSSSYEKFNQAIINIERRSLNVMRRLCVIDLAPEFLHFMDKLDNRHCYRWIEKSLEFFTKYSLFSTKVDLGDTKGDDLKLVYSSYELLDDCELMLGDNKNKHNNDENIQHIKFIKENLAELMTYKFEPENSIEISPYYNVYTLLDGIGKKLDWPSWKKLSPNTEILKIEDKISLLFSLKQKLANNDPAALKLQIQSSALNKEISFYGLGYFFHKLSEFYSYRKRNASFSDRIVLAADKFYAEPFLSSSFLETNSAFNSHEEKVAHSAMSSLIICLKMWEKFNQHKEISTIVMKCLSNSKLDSMCYYKSFLNDFFTNSYALATNSTSQTAYNWSNLASLKPNQKIPLIAYLFMKEKKSFDGFFKELDSILNEPFEVKQQTTKSYFDYVILSNLSFCLFELNRENVHRYFSNLMLEKISQLNALAETLSNKNSYAGLILVLVQVSLQSLNPSAALNVYNSILKIIKTSSSFEYTDFYKYIYDVRILQDFCELRSSSDSKRLKLSLDDSDSLSNEEFKERMLKQLKSNLEAQKDGLLETFLNSNKQNLRNLMNDLIKNCK